MKPFAKPVFPLLLILSVYAAQAQLRETFDIITFTPPKGWQRESTNNVVSFVITNNKTGNWSRLSVYKSIISNRTPAADFDHEWNELVTKVYQGSTKPVPETSVEDGWTAHSGVSPFTWQGKSSLILLNTISGYGREVVITVTMNSQTYMSHIQAFLNSIDLQKPSQSPSSTVPAPTLTQSDPKPVTSGANGSGITKSTTYFDDGWTAKAMDDYVLVTKENTKFYIHYGFPIPPNSLSSESGTTKENWDKLITPRYDVINLWLNPDVGSFGGLYNYYAEGTAIERSTGNQVFIGFRTIINGAYFCVEAVAPTKEEYLKHFPSIASLKDMRGSNRFAVTKQDVVGDWSGSDGSALQYYNVYTGQSAGMQYSQGGQEFFFRSTDDYNANISGAIGTMGGSQVFFNDKHKGTFNVTDWEITFTGYGGKTQVFTAYFEAVRGGRILHMAKKDAPGVHYPLVKVK
ncbi:MAG: hypothetical protein KF725_13605 [Cyclobacteriaceae bacterium]|nr:hypothetical protein [Cyclobacteriaceae bacterium]UYN85343.1 MAG: hypothetical protein KIT51_10610 [Cyclobacteriaceae bacterium]